ncbi:MAG: hypothetical protein EHM40_03005 [Chloroflexi bacterium]|nr:MAG: hypothetical protein EHM40_03005 [Chloroflexota bacterium]
MKMIPLSQGKSAIVDDEDYEGLMRWKWGAHYVRKYNEWSVVRSEHKLTGRKFIYIHRQIMNAPGGMEVDHKDGNRFNNQKSNLRLCSHQQNMFNRRPQKGSVSIYKGVSWHKGNQKWQARITVSGKPIHLGYYGSEIEAAKTYDDSAIKYYGDYAYLNFPGES